MKNAIALGALIAVLSLTSSYGDSKPKKTTVEQQKTSRDAAFAE